MRILITGGAGFIGSNLALHALDKGHDVVVYDDMSAGKVGNLGENARNVEVVCGDIADRDTLDAAVSRCDAVFHLAARVGVRTTIEKPIETFETNAVTSKGVFESCLKHDLPVAFASSSETYGINTDVPLTEESLHIFEDPPNGRWIYAYSKLIAEAYCMELAAKGLRYTILRYFNCYGPRMTRGGYASVVSKFMGQAIEGKPITVYGDGSQTRCFIYVRDLVATTLNALDARAQNTTVNVGSQEEITILELAHKIKSIGSSASPVIFVDPERVLGKPFTETHRRMPDNGRARERLRLSTTTSLDYGLREVLSSMHRERAA